MISLDPDFIGRIDKSGKELRDAERKETAGEQQRKSDEKSNDDVKNKMRGKNSALKKYLRKKNGGNVIDERRLKLEALQKERALRNKGLLPASAEEKFGPALARFGKRPAR